MRKTNPQNSEGPVPEKAPVPDDTVEAGATLYLIERTKEIRVHLQYLFPEYWTCIYVVCLIRTIYCCPLHMVPFYCEHSLLPYIYPDVQITNTSISDLISYIGFQTDQIRWFMLRMSAGRKQYLILKGSDSRMSFSDRMNVLYMFTTNDDGSFGTPSFYRQFPGSTIDRAALGSFLKDQRFAGGAVAIGDKDMGNDQVFSQMSLLGLRYIIPLRRGNDEVKDLNLGDSSAFPGRFSWHGQAIKFLMLDKGDYRVYVFLDRHLRADEFDLCKYNEEPNYHFPPLHPSPVPSDEEDRWAGDEHELGTLTIRTTVKNASARRVFSLFRLRQEIPEFLRTYPNPACDASFLRFPSTMEGWLFLNHVSTIMAFDTLEHIQSVGLRNNLSLRDWYGELRTVQASRINGKWVFPPIKEDLLKTCALFGFDPTDISGLE